MKYAAIVFAVVGAAFATSATPWSSTRLHREMNGCAKDCSAFERPARVDVVHNALTGLQRSRRVSAPAPHTSIPFWLRCCPSRSVPAVSPTD